MNKKERIRALTKQVSYLQELVCKDNKHHYVVIDTKTRYDGHEVNTFITSKCTICGKEKVNIQ